ncbi:MAG: glycosyltransferase [Candidatus Omnitrophota bacterium]
MKVAFYPNTVFDWSNPLWRMLKGALLKHNVEVAKMKFSFFSLLRNKNRINAIHFHYVYPDFPPFLFMHFPRRIRNKLCSVRCQYQNKTFGLKLKAAKTLGYKILYTAHNLNFHDRPTEDMKRNLKLLYALADAVVAMGKDAMEKISESAGKRPVKIIPPFHFKGAYENTITREEARAKLRIPQKSFVYLHFGNIKRYKGIDILVRLFKRENPDAILLIAGDTSLDPLYVRELKELINGDERILTVEYKKPDDIQFFMNAADIAVFPFRQITNSSAVMLAKSFYKPTVCMNKGNTADYASTDTDILAEDESSFQKALVEARNKNFPKDKNKYLKGIPSVDEVAGMHKQVYEEL